MVCYVVPDVGAVSFNMLEENMASFTQIHYFIFRQVDDASILCALEQSYRRVYGVAINPSKWLFLHDVFFSVGPFKLCYLTVLESS